ncbi:MAG: LmeA family phospholipid-binding protein [Candidatus Rifleibacteriota bacterium]
MIKEKCLRNKYVVPFFIIVLVLFCNQLSGENKPPITSDPEIAAQIASDTSIIHRKLIKSMKKVLTDPATLTIDITEFNREETIKGHLKRVEVFTSNGSVDNLMLNTADIDFENVWIDTRKLLEKEEIDPVKMSNINMYVVIKEKDMNSFLEKKSKSIKVNRPRINMKNGKIELSGSTRYGWAKVEFWARGVFSIKNSQEIWFHPKRMKVNRMAMPRSFTGMITRKINPIFNLEEFPFKLNLKEIKVTNDQMIFNSFRKGEKE